MAEQQGYDNAGGDQQAILAEHERGWESFTRFLTYAIVAVVLILLGLLLFVA